ncbi:MAG: DUF1236 domain-containing protein [Alphaproteobacteria bacterium]|nr:DUF1236 domain-containing protein [Alphaproteobacteria bacterium]
MRRGNRDLDISFRVGVGIPRTVELYSVPSFIVDIAPAYRDYRYYYDGDVIVIVNPNTYRIVDVIYL